MKLTPDEEAYLNKNIDTLEKKSLAAIYGMIYNDKNEKLAKRITCGLAVLRGDYSIFILKFKYALKDPDSNAKLYKWDLKFKFGYMELSLAQNVVVTDGDILSWTKENEDVVLQKLKQSCTIELRKTPDLVLGPELTTLVIKILENVPNKNLIFE